MNEQQADTLIDELHELNETLKTIASNQERSELNPRDLSDAIGKDVERAITCLFENERKDLS